MGHEVQYLDFDYCQDKKEITAQADAIYDRNCEYGGSTGGIDFKDITPFMSAKAAQEYLDHLGDMGYYYQGAVPYYSFKNLIPSAKLTKLKDQLKECNAEYIDLCRANYLATLTAKFVTCKNCGSKLNRELRAESYNHESCPVCHKDLRPTAWLDKIKATGEKLNALKAAVKAEEDVCRKAQIKNANKKWLVRIEYHV